MTDRTPLAPEAIEAFLATSTLWSQQNDTLTATLRLKDFKAALSFMVAIGLEAEALDHHPEIHNIYNKLTLTLTTHDTGNRITALDLALARKIESIATRFTPA